MHRHPLDRRRHLVQPAQHAVRPTLTPAAKHDPLVERRPHRQLPEHRRQDDPRRSARARNARTARAITASPPSVSSNLFRGPPNRVEDPAAGIITASSSDMRTSLREDSTRVTRATFTRPPGSVRVLFERPRNLFRGFRSAMHVLNPWTSPTAAHASPKTPLSPPSPHRNSAPRGETPRPIQQRPDGVELLRALGPAQSRPAHQDACRANASVAACKFAAGTTCVTGPGFALRRRHGLPDQDDLADPGPTVAAAAGTSPARHDRTALPDKPSSNRPPRTRSPPPRSAPPRPPSPPHAPPPP